VAASCVFWLILALVAMTERLTVGAYVTAPIEAIDVAGAYGLSAAVASIAVVRH